MKICYIGGGGIKILSEIRELLKLEQVKRSGCEIALYDIVVERAEIIAALVRQTPEIRKHGNVVVVCPDTLEPAIKGADFVVMIARPGGVRNDIYGRRIAVESGFIGTDNLSLNGAFLSLDGVPVVMDIARKMEKLAPDGVMLIFTNPIAILVNAVNTYTKIKALGICAGEVNHCYDIPRLMQWDQPCFDMQVEAAGINHLSFFQKLSLNGKNLLPVLRELLDKKINLDDLKDRPTLYESMKFTVPKLQYACKYLDAPVFSSEGDGLSHLCYYDEMVEYLRKKINREGDPEKALQRQYDAHQKQYKELQSLAALELGDEFWNDSRYPWTAYSAPAYRHACGVRVIDGLSSDRGVEIALTYPNHDNAVQDFPEHIAMEYTISLNAGRISKKNSYKLPTASIGVIRSLAEFQYAVASAIVEESKEKFIQGLYAYPMCRDMNKFKLYWEKMKSFRADSLPEFLRD